MKKLDTRSFKQKQAPDWANFVSLCYGSWYWEESLEQEDGARFQNINSNIPHRYCSITHRGWDMAYRLPQRPCPARGKRVGFNAPTVTWEQVDKSLVNATVGKFAEELPPPLESGLYHNLDETVSVSLRIKRDITKGDGLIYIGITGYPNRVHVSTHMTAETARDMAHDLYRMARLLEKESK